MIRPITLLTALMFVLSGAYLFVVKHRAQVLDDQIAATDQATRLDAQRVRVLQAQWALEVDPSRLAQLSAEFTSLQPMTPSQLVTLASLGGILPPPGSAPPAQNPASPMPAALPAVLSTVAIARAEPARPAVHAVAAITHSVSPERLSSVESLLHNLPRVHRDSHPHHELAAHLYAEARNPAPQVSALAPQPYIASIIAPRAMPVSEQIIPLPVVTRTAQAARPATPMDGGSMLGMAQTMSATGAGN